MHTVGTCSLCGGPVKVPLPSPHWGGHQAEEPVPTCASCGAKKEYPYGPIIKMVNPTEAPKVVKEPVKEPDARFFRAGQPQL